MWQGDGGGYGVGKCDERTWTVARSLDFFLTFMGPCIVNIFQYISTKMQLYTVYLHLETALHVSGGTSTHHQEHIRLYLQHMVFFTPLLPPAAMAAGGSILYIYVLL